MVRDGQRRLGGSRGGAIVSRTCGGSETCLSVLVVLMASIIGIVVGEGPYGWRGGFFLGQTLFPIRISGRPPPPPHTGGGGGVVMS